MRYVCEFAMDDPDWISQKTFDDWELEEGIKESMSRGHILIRCFVIADIEHRNFPPRHYVRQGRRDDFIRYANA